MCGIFGLVAREDLNIDSDFLKSTVDQLFKLSESRGKEAAGIAVQFDNAINVYKEAIPASVMIRTPGYKNFFHSLFESTSIKSQTIKSPVAVIGHSRLVTNGLQEVNSNNQPVISSGMVGVHNGIVVNVNELWEKYPSLERKYEVDSEIIMSLIGMYYQENISMSAAVRKTFNQIQGAASIAALSDYKQLILATNTGSLYTCTNKSNSFSVFASERYILKTLVEGHHLRNFLDSYNIYRVEPGNGCIIDLSDLSMKSFSFKEQNIPESDNGHHKSKLEIVNYSKSEQSSPAISLDGADNLLSRAKAAFHDDPFLHKSMNSIEKLRRCTKCILPETVPLISFDEKGVCCFCNNYQKIKIKESTALEEYVAPYRSNSGEPDCIVAFSGGRDSSYGLHYIKNVLKMNPIAYTYDWGMVTDLGRRNQARMCGELGVEHILISADIKKKRKNVQRNINAWLKKPEIGMIPLFMAGDKQFFYYANELKKQTGVELVIFCGNKLERTNFKSAFSGVDEKNTRKRSMPWTSKLKIALYYAEQYMKNPSYINRSMLDTIFAYYSYYFLDHTYLFLYEYIKWDEKEINKTLIGEYDWELAVDTKSTWRIGDGTVAFYNYIYYFVAGFSENDTFRSNQIREGIISREEALDLVRDENKPRYETLRWYADTIDFDLDAALKVINKIPKFYSF